MLWVCLLDVLLKIMNVFWWNIVDTLGTAQEESN